MSQFLYLSLSEFLYRLMAVRFSQPHTRERHSFQDQILLIFCKVESPHRKLLIIGPPQGIIRHKGRCQRSLRL